MLVWYTWQNPDSKRKKRKKGRGGKETGGEEMGGEETGGEETGREAEEAAALLTSPWEAKPIECRSLLR